MDPVPPVLRRKLRAYWSAYAVVSLVETAAAAVLLALVAGPPWAWLALGWLAWRAGRWPNAYAIARELERRHPALAETLTAAIQVARSCDPEPLKGSPALRALLYAEADRRAGPVASARLVPWQPAALLVTAALAVGVALPRPTPPSAPPANGSTASQQILVAPPPASAQPSVATPARLAALRARLEELNRQLQALPEDVRRALPAYARTLDQAQSAAARAEAALGKGQAAEAEFLTQSVADLLAEFTRLAQAIPELAALATAAGQLAGQYAAVTATPPSAAGATPVTPTGMSAQPGTTNLANQAPAGAVVAAVLPAAPQDAAWAGGTSGQPPAAGLGRVPLPGYDQLTRDYFDHLAHIAN